jgi:hypothetical protein
MLEGRITIAALFLIVMSAVGCADHAQNSRNTTLTDLAPCPYLPNCVSTISKNPGAVPITLPRKGITES